MSARQVQKLWEDCILPNLGTYLHDIKKKLSDDKKPSLPLIYSVSSSFFTPNDLARMRDIYRMHSWSSFGHFAVTEYINTYGVS